MEKRNFIRLWVPGVLILALAAYLVSGFYARSLVSFAARDNATLAEGKKLWEKPGLSYKAPQFAGITAWLNSPPLTMSELRGKVVLVDFWTYACINCVRALPYTIEWDRKYRSQGLVVVGVHTPEFEFEKDIASVREAVARHGIRYPVALDNRHETWNGFSSHAWPAHYIIDRNGKVVYTHFGEGGYDITEGNIRYLLGLGSGSKQEAAVKRDSAVGQRQAPQPGRVFRDCTNCPDMVVVPAGSFEMGAQPDTHHVEIDRPIAIGRYEVTQAEWQAVMGNNPSHFKGANLPVEQVSWNDVQEFIRKINRRTGKQYRLPTEAEWEYACRAGAMTEYCGSDDVNSVAWYGPPSGSGNSSGMTHPSGARQPNAFGLYDMSGNVWEWVADTWHADYSGAPADGSMWQGDGGRRVIRGGSWLDYPLLARASFRVWGGEQKRSSDLGFRLARSLQK